MEPGHHAQASRTRDPAEASNEVIMPARRRSFTPAEKLRIVRAADACVARGDVEAMLRREGIYHSHLATWRKALARHGVEGLAARRPGRKLKRDAKDLRIDTLEKRNARRDSAIDLEPAEGALDVVAQAVELLAGSDRLYKFSNSPTVGELLNLYTPALKASLGDAIVS
jgi:transposase-like protein